MAAVNFFNATPRGALNLLRRVNNDFSNTSDHEVLQHMSSILRRCQWPTPSELESKVSSSSSDDNIYHVLKQIVTGATGMLKCIYLRIMDSGLTSQGFQTNMKIHLNDIVHVLKTIIKLLENSTISPGDIWFMKEMLTAAKVLLESSFSKQYPYQTHPKMIAGSNRLWSKVKKMSLRELTEDIQGTECIVCFSEFEDSQFAILDSCPHLVCLPCAHRLFNLPEESDRKCPMCRAVVKSYTSSYHAVRYKTTSNFLSSAMKTLKSLKKSFSNAPDSTE